MNFSVFPRFIWDKFSEAAQVVRGDRGVPVSGDSLSGDRVSSVHSLGSVKMATFLGFYGIASLIHYVFIPKKQLLNVNQPDKSFGLLESFLSTLSYSSDWVRFLIDGSLDANFLIIHQISIA